MSVRVYLADLRYNYLGVLANDCMPLGVAYMKAVMDAEEPGIESRLFAYPDRLLTALRQEPPDVLMLSNYVWNQALSLRFAAIAKRINPGILTVMGGPNLPLEPQRQISFVKAHPELDLYVLGEGDFLALEMVRRFLEADKSLRKFGSTEIPSSVYRNGDGQVVRTQMLPRRKSVDDIPSPWLAGILDQFFDGKLAPMIETNRGCPFSCTFCVQGTRWYTKIHNFSKERIREELHYIARRIVECCPQMGTLRIADSNYGMFERDIEISSYIGETQRLYRWPTFIDATTGKNRPERIIKSVEKTGGAMVLYQAVQSLDENVLRKVKRQTIKLEAYEQLQVHMRGRGLRSTSDLILGLPGETLESHLKALHRLLDSGIDSLHNFQAMMLKGSEMETLASRNEFHFVTKFRLLPKNFGIYGDEIILDTEEIVVATDTLSFDDYVTARKYHLNSSIFWNDGWFKPVVQFAQAHGIRPSEWWDHMLKAMENDTGAARELLDQFVEETQGELFDSHEECVAFYQQPENFQKLCRGEIGENLMYKYRALASFHIWPYLCRMAMDATREMLEQRGIPEGIRDFDRFWTDFHEYVQLRHADSLDPDRIGVPVTAELLFDIDRWLAEGDPADPGPFRLSQPTVFQFELPPESAREMKRALEVWGTQLTGLSKLVTRINVAWQVRECREREPKVWSAAV